MRLILTCVSECCSPLVSGCITILRAEIIGISEGAGLPGGAWGGAAGGVGDDGCEGF